MTRAHHASFAAIAAVALALTSACSLYFGDDDDGDDDAPPVAVDGGPDRVPDASPVPQPDAATTCQTVDQFRARFGACMQFADWQAAGMCDVPNQPTDMGACTACHSAGEDRAFLNADCQMTFEAHRAAPYIAGLVRPTGDAEGCFTGFRNGTLLAPTFGGPHPTFTFTEARVTAINDFFGFTFARVNDPQFVCD